MIRVDWVKEVDAFWVSGERVSGDRVSGDRVSGERVSGDRVSGDDINLHYAGMLGPDHDWEIFGNGLVPGRSFLYSFSIDSGNKSISPFGGGLYVRCRVKSYSVDFGDGGFCGSSDYWSENGTRGKLVELDFQKVLTVESYGLGRVCFSRRKLDEFHWEVLKGLREVLGWEIAYDSREGDSREGGVCE